MATMSHTPQQRKAWHDGARKPGEDTPAWFRRVLSPRRGTPNYRAAYTPAFLKRRITYQALRD